MKLSTDINCFYGKFSIFDTIDIIADAGFEEIDFSFMDKSYYDGTVSAEECVSHYKEVRKYAASRGLTIGQSHAPCLTFTDDEEENEIIFKSIARSIANASVLGAKTIVVHGYNHIDYSALGGAERLFELNMNLYNRLRPYCEKYGVKIGVENMFRHQKFSDVNAYFGYRKGTRGICTSPDEFVRYMDTLGTDNFVACLDIGHATVGGERPEEIIYALGKDRLGALHIHDNNGLCDMHTVPYIGGAADWDKIMKALADIGYDGSFSFEAGNFFNQFPKELFPECAAMVAKIGKHLIAKANR